MKNLQIFISSPGDVIEERAIALRVIERLQSEYVGRVVLEPVLWEHEPLRATGHFQDQIVPPSKTDIVISILWSRLGTRLPKNFARDDGSRYESGTEYEFEEAIQGFRKIGKPDLLVYRKTAPPSVRLDDEQELMQRLEQKKKLDQFVEKWFHDKAEGTLKGAFHPFESPSDFESLLENHLHKLLDRQLPGRMGAAPEAAAVWKKGSPFRGLHAFDFEHGPIFFGRTRAISDILQALREQAAEERAFVLILGMSGGGKSSVVRAGVLPMLTRPGLIEGVALWKRAVFRPTDVRGDLFAGLATAILREPGLPALDSSRSGPEELAQVLRESPKAAVSLIRNALAHESAAPELTGEVRLALVIDQMEEMFTQEDVTAKQRKAFVDTLDALSRCGKVWIVGTLRSDFYPRLANLPKLAALKEGAGQYDLMPPTASEIAQMIRLPTRAAALRFEEDPSSSERLDDMLRDAATGHPEVLPLLQFTLEELYHRRTDNGMLTLAAYRELGGVEGSLAQRAETIYQQLSTEAQAELPRVLNALVSIEQDGHETIGRKRAPWTAESSGAGNELIRTFVDARLFVTELADDGNAVVAVAHEALLWHWPRIRDWVAQNRQNLRIRSRIAVAAQRWQKEKQPADLLLPAGRPLVEAESLLDHDIELEDVESGYIEASVARARRFQRIKAGVVAALALMVVVAGWSAFEANQQRSLADQALTRAEIDAETALRTRDFMVELFEVSDPGEAQGNTITAREILDKGAQRIETQLADQPVTQATLMDTIGTVYTKLGLYHEAAALLEMSLKIREDELEPLHPDTVTSMNHVAEALGYRGDFQGALTLYQQALEMSVQSGNDDSLEAATSTSGMAQMLMEQGKYGDAEPLHAEALEMRRRILGNTHPTVAATLRNSGLNYFYLGQYEQAESLLREAVRMRRELHESEHPDLAFAINDLAWALFELDELEEAEALYREALAMKVALLGDNHPEVALALNNVALVNAVGGNLGEAEALYRRAISVQRESVGESHPNLALFMSNLAALLYEKDEAEAAIDSAKEALALRRELLDDDHPQVADGAAMVAYWSMQMGDYAQAEVLLDECLSIRRNILGASHADVASALTLKAGVQLATERFAEAYDTAREARQILEASFSADHWRTAAAANAEGAALAGLGRYEEAEGLLLPTNEILVNAPMPGIQEQSRYRLAQLYTAWGKEKEAQKYVAQP